MECASGAATLCSCTKCSNLSWMCIQVGRFTIVSWYFMFLLYTFLVPTLWLVGCESITPFCMGPKKVRCFYQKFATDSPRDGFQYIGWRGFTSIYACFAKLRFCSRTKSKSDCAESSRQSSAGESGRRPFLAARPCQALGRRCIAWGHRRWNFHSLCFAVQVYGWQYSQPMLAWRNVIDSWFPEMLIHGW